jgi:adhesin transport system outer membrane protein
MAFGSVGGAKAATMSEVVQHTIQTNPEILQSAANRRAIDQELNQARGLYWPQVDLRAAWGPEYSNNTTTRGRGTRGTDTPGRWLPRAESQLTLQQRLFDGFETESEIERQAARSDAAAHRVRERSEFIALDAVQAYLDVLRNTEIVDQAAGNVEGHKRHLGNVRTRFQGGQSGIGDVRQAEARVADSEATLVSTQRDLEDSIIFFSRVVGREADDMVRPELKGSWLPRNVGAAAEIGIANNPTIKLAEADLDVSRAEISATKVSFWPTLNLELSGTRNDNLDGTPGVNHDFTGLVVLRYNLFRGFIDQARTREFVERFSESHQRLLDLKRRTKQEVRNSWNAMTKSQERLKVLTAQVKANEQVLDTYRQEFQIGQRDLLDLLDAQNELFNSRVQAITSDFVAQFGGYRLLASMGELLNVLGVSVRDEAGADKREEFGVTPDWRWQTRDPLAADLVVASVAEEEKTIAADGSTTTVTSEELKVVPAAAGEISGNIEPAFEPTIVSAVGPVGQPAAVTSPQPAAQAAGTGDATFENVNWKFNW